jgi:hypothetical protein
MDLFDRPIDFLNPEVGWTICTAFADAAESPVRLMKTSDGGESWEMIANLRDFIPGHDFASGSLRFLDAENGWFGSNGSGLYRTHDGGSSWQVVATGSGAITLVEPFSDDEIFIALEGVGVFRTVDEGQTWSKLYPPGAALAERPCRAQDLTAELLDFNGASQSFRGGVVVTNAGQEPCFVRGRPDTTVVTTEGVRLLSPPSGTPLDIPPVALLPGQRASVGIALPTSCHPTFSEGAALSLLFPDGEVTAKVGEFAHRPTGYCTNPPSSPGVGVFEAASPPITPP